MIIESEDVKRVVSVMLFLKDGDNTVVNKLPIDSHWTAHSRYFIA